MAMTKKKMLFKGKANSIREFIHVKDAAECSVEILKPDYANQHIVLTGNQLMTIEELLKMIAEILNDKDIIIELDLSIFNTKENLKKLRSILNEMKKDGINNMKSHFGYRFFYKDLLTNVTQLP